MSDVAQATGSSPTEDVAGQISHTLAPGTAEPDLGAEGLDPAVVYQMGFDVVAHRHYVFGDLTCQQVAESAHFGLPVTLVYFVHRPYRRRPVEDVHPLAEAVQLTRL